MHPRQPQERPHPKKQPERRQQTLSLVEELQKERDQVWSLYSQIAELKPYSSDQQIQPVLNEFAQLLIDYISLGEFGIYQRITDGTERRIQVKEAAEKMYPEFSCTSDMAVSFNDKYANTTPDQIAASLEQDLSQLGEGLAKRIDIEDHICGLILRRKSDRS